MSIPKDNPKGKSRKTYEKPDIVYREIIEIVSGSCDVQDPVNGKTGVGDNCTTIGSG